MSEDIKNYESGRLWPDVMVDLETFGIGARAAIISIGVVAFDGESREIGPRRQWDPHWKQPGRKVDGETLHWWFEQREEGVKVPHGEQPLEECLVELGAWLDDFSEPAAKRRMWAKGPSFDLAILADAFRWAEIGYPRAAWRHWNERCVRTVLEGAEERGWQRCRMPACHNALEDALRQAEEVTAALKFLEGMDWASTPEVDYDGAWEVYRQVIGSYPWHELPHEVKDAWRLALDAGVKWARKEHGARGRGRSN